MERDRMPPEVLIPQIINYTHFKIFISSFEDLELPQIQMLIMKC